MTEWTSPFKSWIPHGLTILVAVKRQSFGFGFSFVVSKSQYTFSSFVGENSEKGFSKKSKLQFGLGFVTQSKLWLHFGLVT